MADSTSSGDWRKSTLSGDGDCVEWKVTRDGVLVRRCELPDSAALAFSFSEWRAFLAGVRVGEADLDLPAEV